MSLPPDVVRRLAFAKYLFTLGRQQAKTPSPLNAAAVLMFHDAAEFFLLIASEHLDAGTRQPNFMDYFDSLSAKTSEPLSQKETMRRLNKARVALKHHGTMPSGDDVSSFGEATARFFEENTPRIFGMTFAELTLVEFVEPESARQRLRAALDALAHRTITHDALTDVAIAFDQITRHREREISPPVSFPIFPFGREFPGPWGFRFSHDVDRGVAQAISGIGSAVAGLQRVSKLLVMGVDFVGMLRFQGHTPTVVQAGDGSYQSTFHAPPELVADADDLEFCIQFVIDTSLTFQQGVRPWNRGPRLAPRAAK